MKLKFLVAAGLFWAAGTAWGQVAAPSLVPATFAAENPAAIKWGSPSRVGVLAGTVATKTNNGGPEYETTGESVGVRLVGNWFAVAAEGSQLDDKSVATNLNVGGTLVPVTARTSYNAQDAQLAVQLGGRLALGVGQKTETAASEMHLSPPFPPVIGTETKSVTPIAGVSLRLGEWLFLGGAAGQEDRTRTDLTTQVSEKAVRDVTKAGIGIRTAGAVLFHLEGYSIDKTNFKMVAGPQDAEQRAGGTVEMIAGPILLSYNAEHTDFKNSIDKDDKRDAQTVAVGWAPRMGLSVAVHLREEKTYKLVTPGNPQQINTFQLALLAIAYQW